jgi:hypothetical protein
MALFHFKWLRRFVRQNTNPIPMNKAEKWKSRLSLMYGLLAWNAFGLVCYMVYTGKNDWAKYYGVKKPEDDMMSPAQQFAQTFNMPKAKILRYHGLTKVEEVDVVPPEQPATTS